MSQTNLSLNAIDTKHDNTPKRKQPSSLGQRPQKKRQTPDNNRQQQPQHLQPQHLQPQHLQPQHLQPQQTYSDRQTHQSQLTHALVHQQENSQLSKTPKSLSVNNHNQNNTSNLDIYCKDPKHTDRRVDEKTNDTDTDTDDDDGK